MVVWVRRRSVVVGVGRFLVVVVVVVVRRRSVVVVVRWRFDGVVRGIVVLLASGTALLFDFGVSTRGC